MTTGPCILATHSALCHHFSHSRSLAYHRRHQFHLHNSDFDLLITRRVTPKRLCGIDATSPETSSAFTFDRLQADWRLVLPHKQQRRLAPRIIYKKKLQTKIMLLTQEYDFDLTSGFAGQFRPLGRVHTKLTKTKPKQNWKYCPPTYLGLSWHLQVWKQ